MGERPKQKKIETVRFHIGIFTSAFSTMYYCNTNTNKTETHMVEHN